jgi:alpha-tubulin suppressor-like RCC1 family protein
MVQAARLHTNRGLFQRALLACLVHSAARPLVRRTTMRTTRSPFSFALIAPLSLLPLAAQTACGSSAGVSGSPPASDEATGTVTAMLSVVPTTVQCVKITVSPEGTTQLVSPGTGGWPASVDLGVLQAGPVTVDGVAYDQPCKQSWGHDPSWVADEVTTQVYSGSATKIALVFHQNPHSSGTVEFAPSVQAMALGDVDTYALMADGTVMYWGVDVLDRKTPHKTPTPLAGITGAKAIAAGEYFGCAIMADATVKCWGASDGTWSLLANGQLIANGVPPTPIAGLTGVVQIAPAEDHVCVLTADSSVYCWGKNTNGEFCDGTFNDANNAPVKSDFSYYGVQQIATNTSQINALLWDGSVRFSEATTIPFVSDVPLPGVFGAQQISMGYNHACAVLVDGTVACWGANDSGQLGNGTTAQPTLYEGTPVVGLTDAVQVAAYGESSCAITKSGQVKCWGDNTMGELGDGHADPSFPQAMFGQITPNIPVVGITAATALPSGFGENACAVLVDSTVRCWGDNSSNQLGDGTGVDRFESVMPAF